MFSHDQTSLLNLHLLFYDGHCGLCDHAVQFVLKRDKKEQFVFASLQGKTALTMLKDASSEAKEGNSLVLIENYQSDERKTYLRGKAVFRICWLLGGKWAILGVFFWLPSLFYDWIYRLVAKNRYRLFNISCFIPKRDSNRFLP